MFLKNDSIYKIGLRTIKGNLEVKPNEIIHIMESDLLDMDEHLVIVKEQEYENYINNISTKELVETEEDENKLIGHPESCKPCFKDGKNPSDEDCLKCKEQKLKEELDEINSKDNVSDRKDIDTNTKTLSKDESVIAKLKEQWEKAKKPAEKAKIAKQLKKLEGK